MFGLINYYVYYRTEKKYILLETFFIGILLLVYAYGYLDLFSYLIIVKALIIQNVIIYYVHKT